MEKKDYGSVMEFMRDGFGPRLAVALMDCVENYLPSLARNGDVPCYVILENHWCLCQLLKCVLRDEYGIDLEGDDV